VEAEAVVTATDRTAPVAAREPSDPAAASAHAPSPAEVIGRHVTPSAGAAASDKNAGEDRVPAGAEEPAASDSAEPAAGAGSQSAVAETAGASTPGDPARRRARLRQERDRRRSVAIEERQSIALTTLAVTAVLVAAYLARTILMPMVLAITLTLTFRPAVRAMKRRGIPMAVSAGMVILTLVGVALIGTIYLAEPARDWIQGAPDDLREVSNRLHGVRDSLLELQQASQKLEDLASGEPAAETTEEPETPTAESGTPAELGSRLDEGGESEADSPVAVEVRQPRLMTGLQALGSAGTVLGSLVLTLVLTYFLLSGSDALINNVLHILPSMREKRNVVELVYNVERGISAYLSTVTCINAGLGVCIGLAMWALGMPNPALWGVMGALLNFVPYLGAMVGTIVVSLVAVLSFDSIGHAALVPLTYFALTAVEGNFITPTILGRSMSLNPVMVFLALTFWGWMWGIVGALLAVPILTMLKIGFDQFERTRPIGTLLGE
jgi:predicted PurR-regulated permease PerM